MSISPLAGAKSGSPGAAAGSPDSPSAVARGYAAIKDTLGSAASSAGATAGAWKARGASILYKVVVVPLSYIWEKLAGAVNWVLGRARGEKAEIVTEVEKRGWTGRYMDRVNLTTALADKDITPDEALKKHAKDGCDQNYLNARGYGTVKFEYTWFGMSYNYDGKLRTALRKGYITIQEAIDQGMITKAQAIEGKFLKAEKPAKK